MLAPIMTLVAAGLGCQAPPPDEESGVEALAAPLLGGAERLTHGDNGTQESEAVAAVAWEGSIPHYLYATNSDDGDKIAYSDHGTPGDYSDDRRTVYLDASGVRVFHRGAASQTIRLTPPAGWSFLWGDPGIAAAGSYAFATTLAGPSSKWPHSGDVYRAPYVVNRADDPLNTFIGQYLGGACIARSTDYGLNWSLASADCVTDQGHFYDGSSVAVTPAGKVFAAFQDVDGEKIDVWRTSSATGSFWKTDNPFPGRTPGTHPRVVVGANGKIYIVMIDEDGNIWFSAHHTDAQWHAPVLAGKGAYVDDIVLRGSGTSIRQANGLSFAVGPGTYSNEMRLVFTKKVGELTVLQGVRCIEDGSWSCQEVADWRTSSSRNAFLPAVDTMAIPVPVPMGSAYRYVWKVSYHMDASSGKVAIHHSNLSVGAFPTARVTDYQYPCPDGRGYWGDYDSMTHDQTDFVRPFSDSTDGSAACTRQNFTSSPLGVSVARMTPDI